MCQHSACAAVVLGVIKSQGVGMHVRMRYPKPASVVGASELTSPRQKQGCTHARGTHSSASSLSACCCVVRRGGVNSWQNLVTACMSCNQRKGDKGLQQLGWKLPCVPREPSPQEVGIVAGISKVRSLSQVAALTFQSTRLGLCCCVCALLQKYACPVLPCNLKCL
jgi:hypothetical protein